MSVTLYASGTQTATVTTEHFLSSPNVAGAFRLQVDLSGMLANDVVELRVYKMTLTSGTSRVAFLATFYGAQNADAYIAVSERMANTLTDTNAVRFSLKQTFGTSRNFAWAVLNEEDFTGNMPSNVIQWNSSNVSAPATAGIPEVNVKNINNVSAAAVTTVKAVQGLTTADTIATYTGNTVQTGDGYARLGAPVGASISADVAAVKSVLGTPAGASLAADLAEIEGETDTLIAGVTVTTNNDKTGYALTAGERNSVADAIFIRAMVESYAALTAAPTLAQALFEIRSILSDFAISGTTVTTKKLDGSSTATTATLDSSTAPTSRARAT